MKMKSLFLVPAIVFGLAGFCKSADRTYGGYLVNDKALSYDADYDLNLDKIDDLSMQAIYSSATVASVTFDDGSAAVGSITVTTTTGLTGKRVAINGYLLTEGISWTAVATASGCAKAISDAAMLDPRIAAIVTSTWTGGVVYATATASGTAGNSITLYSSKPTALTLSGSTLSGGTDSDVNVATDKIYAPAHGFSTGLPVYFSTAGTPPTGLTDGTTYYAIVSDASHIQLAETSTGAVAGLEVDITAQATLGGGSFTLEPTPFAGDWTFKWQGSNDGINFFDLINAPSVTYTAPDVDEWDGPIYFRILRFHFEAGTGGGMNIQVIGNGKRHN